MRKPIQLKDVLGEDLFVMALDSAKQFDPEPSPEVVCACSIRILSSQINELKQRLHNVIYPTDNVGVK